MLRTVIAQAPTIRMKARVRVKRLVLTSAVSLALVAIIPAFASAANSGGLKNTPGPLTLYSAHPVEPLVCEYESCGSHSALWYATTHSLADWEWTPSTGERCTGPYGNGHTHGETQWACYGHNTVWYWQVNVDPWGGQTYAKEYKIY